MDKKDKRFISEWLVFAFLALALASLLGYVTRLSGLAISS
jgi:hypothetical protein